MDWWVTKGNQVPVGPVSTDLLLRGIGAGRVPKDALVCEVGGSSWRWIGETAPFSAAFGSGRTRSELDSYDDKTTADPPTNEEFLSSFDDSSDPTTTTIQIPRRWFESMNDNDEQTLVDTSPPRPSDTPVEV
jgi:hypothetical protein